MSRTDKVSAARIRALYRSFTSRRFFVGSSTFGGLAVALISADLAPHNWWRTLAWLALIVLADVVLTVLDRRFQTTNPSDRQLPAWGWARAAGLGFRGMAWSFGPILLYQPGSAISVIVPVWGIINLLSASAYTAAPFFPCLIAVTVCGVVPASIWLGFQQEEAPRLASLLLLLASPFIGFVGMLGRRNVGALVHHQLDLAESLAQQREQTKLIEATMAERTRFFSAASHDLRQPLQALGFYTSMLANRARDDVERDLVDRISECASHLDRQFNAILGMAQTDSAIRRAKIVSFPLRRCLERVELSVRPEAELRSLKLRVINTDLCVAVDPNLLERVLVNLASNAVRYTEAGRVLLGARRKTDAVEIWVVDTGIGITPEDQPRIFEEFYQVGNPARDRERGFGLGLSTVRRLCNGMGWRLELASTPHKGSVFKLVVPRSHDRPEAPTADVEPTLANASSAAGVVIVDDDALVRDATVRMISGWNFEVAACRNGDEALTILSDRDDMIRWLALIDYRLADGETGLVVADRIIQRFGAAVGIILMTAETDETFLQEARRRAILVLRKPVKPIRLRAALTAPLPAPACRPS